MAATGALTPTQAPPELRPGRQQLRLLALDPLRAHTAAKVHDLLDPQKTAGPSSALAGQIVREARDNAEHPNSVRSWWPSMRPDPWGTFRWRLQKNLAPLFGTAAAQVYLPDPQLAIGAYGDADNHEVAPLQFGQFESRQPRC